MPTFIKTGFWEKRILPKQGYKGELNLDYLVSTLVPAVTYAEVISALGYTPEDKSTSAYSMRVNNTNATANATETTYRSPGVQTYTGSITWTATTAPSGATDHSYNWTQIGNLVTLNITLRYSVNGTVVTIAVIDLPSDCPNPVKQSGLTSANEKLYPGSGRLSSSTSVVNISNIISEVYIKNNSTVTGFQVHIQNPSSLPARFAMATIQYFTS
tara:strand:- start:120 stop:761 length:642 start_codon:yes stop_codon:yes gene_type:complete